MAEKRWKIEWQVKAKDIAYPQKKADMEKVLVGMSGGVDSAVSAYMLQKQGYSVSGITLILHDCVKTEVEDAKNICDVIGVEHFAVEFKKKFEEAVIRNFIESYISAKTPNPCIICNENIKFGVLLEKAKELGFDKLATGHYAKIEQENGIFKLKKAKDVQKDQSYVLYRLSQKQLSHVLFPLGNMTKSEVREAAKEASLPSAEREESQENCFIEGSYTDFLLNNLDPSKVKPGDIYDMQGRKLGKHKGLIYYTVGQRSGLGLTTEKPVYVIKIDVLHNAMIVGIKEEIYSKEMEVENIKWTAGEPEYPFEADVKIRRMHKPAKAAVYENKVIFDEPQASITPGQSAVFYQDDEVLGGGFIKK
ncbi:MAG: tRNA 2-thiouridine(34) synthase MnmA [Endomicrobia bacterium]|nr:tRNA 2-thiouridine(34) synthase MnmA [Endomicrobiia bacterium]